MLPGLAGILLAGVVVSGCGGRPPSAPSRPVGDSNGFTATTYHYSTHPTDPTGPSVALRFTWDDGDTSSWTPTTYAYGVAALDSHQWQISGIFHVRAQARDARDRLSPWSDSIEVTITVPGDEPPATPDPPLGPDSGFVNSVYAFRASTTDDDNDTLEYQFDWGDGDTSAWLGPIPPGDTVTGPHAWSYSGTYNIRVQAKDEQGFGSTSGWSPPHITVIR
jgi:hypothetical protein